MKSNAVRRQETVDVFRDRLEQVIKAAGASRAAFAETIGTDRSTLSQLLARGGSRLPRAETIAAIATSAQVSVDWLLGLSQEGQLGTDVVDEAVAIERGGASPADRRLQHWHAEAAGYKIRYVPTTLPDLLKSEAVIRHEYSDHQTLRPEQHIEQAEERLAYTRRPETDMEACGPLQTLEGLAFGEGTWRGLAVPVRRRQLELIAERADELYPTFRWFLFDGRRRFSVPFTVFGNRRAAIYLGDMWLVFSSTEQIRVLSSHFDDLIRAAVVQPTELIALVSRLLGQSR